jgi:hypothetical protein
MPKLCPVERITTIPSAVTDREHFPAPAAVETSAPEAAWDPLLVVMANHPVLFDHYVASLVAKLRTILAPQFVARLARSPPE